MSNICLLRARRIAARFVPVLFALGFALGFAGQSIRAQAAPAAAPPRAAGPGTLSGVVIDVAGRPIPEADVFLMQLQRRMRTRADGTFLFDDVKSGKYTVEARHIGFSPQSNKVTVKDSGAVITLRLERAAFSLPSVLTTAERGGLSGVIADTGFKALGGVKVQVLGAAMGAETDAAGAFFIPVKPGHYLVELKRSGYNRQLVGVTVPEEAGRKLAAWMVPESGGSDAMLGTAIFDLPARINRSNPVWDHYFTREDMERMGARDLRDLASRVGGKPLNPDCPVSIVGDRERVRPLWTLTAEDIEFVETYIEKPDKPLAGMTDGGAAAKLRDAGKQSDVKPHSVCQIAMVVWVRR